MPRTLGSFRKMTAILEAVGIFGILTIELLCYLGADKIQKHGHLIHHFK